MPHICHFENRLQMIGIWGQTKQPQGKTEPSKLCLVSHRSFWPILYMSLTFGSCSTTTMTVRLQEVEDSFPCAPVGNATNIPLWSLVHLDVHLWVSKIPVVYIKIPEEKGTNNTGSLYGSCMMAGSKKSLQSCLLCVLSKTSFIIIYVYMSIM